MTLTQIEKTVRSLSPCSRPQLYRHLRKLRIKPIGSRKRPQIYPDEAAGKILELMGFVKSNGSYRLPTMAELRNERTKAQKARGK